MIKECVPFEKILAIISACQMGLIGDKEELIKLMCKDSGLSHDVVKKL